MGTYAVTGARSGMGHAVVERLAKAGHTVVTVDLADADVTADLSTPSGRQAAAAAVLETCEGTLDGAVMAAGIGPVPGRDMPRRILEVNYLGAVELLNTWRPALAASDIAQVVAITSNSATVVPAVPGRAVDALLADDVERAAAALGKYRAHAPTMAYAASKVALSRWVRRQAVTPLWAGEGVRLNALAPGAVRTPLLEAQLDDPKQAKHLKRFPIPLGEYGEAGDIADWIVFMLGPAARSLCGSVIFVDGGSDAWFRADDWPRPVPVRAIRRYFKRMRAA
ncbi:MAG TPA: SDR family oxidoreductase [Aeromicrobium sp.]|nr:SDR family oxidoreductase [Aeromicrobium sp.]